MKKSVSIVLLAALFAMSISARASEDSSDSYSCTFGRFDYITKEESTVTIETDYTALGSHPNTQQRSMPDQNGVTVFTEAYTPEEALFTTPSRQSLTVS